mgnify:CR=1 FL=1
MNPFYNIWNYDYIQQQAQMQHHFSQVKQVQDTAKALASSVKKKILKELALFGITKETLFCDSIDVACESIKGKFEQKVRGQKQWQLMQPKSALKRI